MGRQPRYEERASRLPLRRLRTRSPRASRLVRYGLRALVVAGAAGAAWFLGTQVANASPADQPAAPQPSSQVGLLGTASHALGSLTESLSSSGGCAAGDTCARPDAGAHDGSARHGSTNAHRRSSTRTAPVASAADAAQGAVPAVSTRPAPDSAGNPGQLPVLGSVLDVTRPVTGSPRTEVSSTASAPSQGPAIGTLTGVLRPLTTTVTDTARPVTGVLAGPLASTTRPVTGLLASAARPLPGATGAVVTSLTGVLANSTGMLPGMAVPAAHAVQSGTAYQALPHGWATVARHWASGPFATWTGAAGTTGHVSGSSLPGFPDPAPPAYPGSGLSSGGTASASGGHSGVGAFAPVASPVVSADSASRVALGTTQADLPRLHEVDPVISPD